MEKYELNNNLPTDQLIGEFVGTLQQSVVIIWQYHLSGCTDYSVHLILDDYYKNMPELIDKLAEEWMGESDKIISRYSNCIDKCDDDYLKYLTLLRNYVDKFSSLCSNKPYLQSGVQSIIGLINSTLYKLNQLHNCAKNCNSIKSNVISLSDFVLKC